MKKLLIALVLCPLWSFAQTWEQLSEEAFKCVLKKEYTKGIERGQAALQLARKQYGTSHIKYGTSLLNLANLHKDHKTEKIYRQKAESYYQQAFEYFKHNNQGHTIEGHLNANYALYMEQMKMSKSTQPYYRKAYEIYRKNLGESHKLTRNAKSKL